jgi:nucleoside-triphosphatase THEP1
MRFEPTAEVMSNRQLTIVTGPIDSGKTSWCRELAAANPGCAGLLLLKVCLRGERIGYDALHLPAGDPVPFARIGGQESPDWLAAERVGPFSISAAALRAANAWLTEASARPALIIIDEIGPLELAGGGLSAGLSAVLASSLSRKVYVVIRSDCVEAACRRFGITRYTLKDVAAGSGEADPQKAGPEKA